MLFPISPEASTGSEPCLPAHDSLWGSSSDAGMMQGARIQAPLPHSLSSEGTEGGQHSLSGTRSRRATAGPPLGLASHLGIKWEKPS